MTFKAWQLITNVIRLFNIINTEGS